MEDAQNTVNTTNDQGQHKHTNRLISETSPYLLQHAHNPVDWYAWSEEALEKAKQEDKPILLSVGYSACHWCHVMERESFENEDIAALMNQHFINELDKIGLQLIKITAGSIFTRGLIVLLEPKSTRMLTE